MAVRREKFVTTKQFLESARSLDITPIEGFYELFDNAFDADARNIRAHIEKKENGNLKFYIIDDGRGIKQTHTDDDGIVHQGIPYVLAYGGRIPHPNRPSHIGKFGVGLSQTASCLSSRTEVYTKTAEDDDWRYSYYDFAELEDEDCLLPQETTKRPPWIDLPETGTIIILQNVDKVKRKTRPGHIVNELEDTLGRVYRKYLGDGRKISISEKKKVGKKDKIEERVLQISDPIHQIPQSKEVQTFGSSVDYGTVTIRFGEDNPIAYIPSFRTGMPAEIRIKLVRLDVEKIRKSLGITSNHSVGGKVTNRIMAKWGINLEGQGFSVVRNGREIRNGETLQLFAKRQWLNYFRGEIEFDDELDDLFRVQTNKSRFTISTRLRDYLRDKCLNTINQIQRDHQKIVSLLSVKRQALAAPTAEQAAAKVVNHPQFKRRKISAAQQKQAEEEIARRVKAMVKTAEEEGKAEVKAAKDVLENVKHSRDKNRIKDAEQAVEMAKQEAKVRVQTIRDRFAFSSPCRKMYGKVGNGDIYSVEDLDTEVWVTINTDSPFYKLLYERATQKPEMESLLDLMLFSIAHSEHLHGHSDKMKEFWSHARNRVSRNAYTFVSKMPSNLES